MGVTIDNIFTGGLTGMSASGKSTLTQIIRDALVEFTYQNGQDVTAIDLDNFYRPIDVVFEIQGIEGSPSDPERISKVNWDDPNLIDYGRVISAIEELKTKGETEVDVYDKLTGTYKGEKITVRANKVLLVESFLLFSAGVPMKGDYASGKKKIPVLENPAAVSERILELIPYRVFVDCNENVGWLRRLARDANKAPRTYEETHELWTRDAFPMAQQYIYPLKKLKKEKGIFDRYIDNSVLSVADIDHTFMDIVNLSAQQLKPEYASPAARHEWIEERYRHGTIEEAQWLRNIFGQRNSH